MRTLRKDLASHVQPDAAQQGLSTVSSVPTAAGGMPGAPLPALAVITGHHPQLPTTIQPDTSGNAAAAVQRAQKLSAQRHRSGHKRPNPSSASETRESILGSHNAKRRAEKERKHREQHEAGELVRGCFCDRCTAMRAEIQTKHNQISNAKRGK